MGLIFLNTMVLNTKQCNLVDEKNNEKRPWPVSFHNYPSCAYTSVPPPPSPLEGFIGDERGYDNLDTKPNSPHIFQTPLSVYHSSSEFPRKIL